MKLTKEYQANDGTRFATADECRRHETAAGLGRLEQMSSLDVEAAINRTDVQLADAIEYAGKLIAEKRRAMGGMRRKRKTIAEKQVEVSATITEIQAVSDAAPPPKKKANLK